MANNVFSHISFGNLSEEGKNFLNDTKDYTIEKFLSAVYSSYSEESDYDWYIENIGAKWIVIEDTDDEYVNVTTAWSPPIPFYEALYEKLVSLNSPDLMMWVQYDDEMPNFVGCFGRSPYGDYEEYLEGEDAYRAAVGEVPSIEDEEGNWEWNDDWYDKLEEWYYSEYDYFQKETKELKEESIDN